MQPFLRSLAELIRSLALSAGFVIPIGSVERRRPTGLDGTDRHRLRMAQLDGRASGTPGVPRGTHGRTLQVAAVRHPAESWPGVTACP